MKARVYVETSVISYLAAPPSRDLVIAAHQQITHDWWRTRSAAFDLFISELVLKEIGAGNPTLARARLDVTRSLQVLAMVPEAVSLANAFVTRGALHSKAEADALHVALAAVHQMSYLVTWNCRHIANAELREPLALVCYAEGCYLPRICTPEELLGD